MSRFYFDRYGIETACLRIGSSFPEPKDRRMLATWLSYDDLDRLVTACLTTPVLGHAIVYGMSDNTNVWWDNTSARHIGFRPQDSSEALPRRAGGQAADDRSQRPHSDLPGRCLRAHRPVRVSPKKPSAYNTMETQR